MEKVVVKFTKAYGAYRSGDIAGFDEKDANLYIESGIAVENNPIVLDVPLKKGKRKPISEGSPNNKMVGTKDNYSTRKEIRK